MMDILQFVFQDFWYWLGTAILLGIIATAIGEFRIFGK